VGGVDTQERRPRAILAEVVRRTVIVAVVAVPLLAASWRVSGNRPLGQFTFEIYLAVAGLLVLCEHWIPLDRRWGSAIGGSTTDFAYVIVATAMDKATFVLCVTTIASVGRAVAGYFHVGLWPSGWSLGFQVAAALLVADAATYLRHRLSHKSDLLWRFHRVHHSMTELYWIRSAYTHPLEQLLILCAIMLPISLLGAGDQVVAVVAFVFGLSGLVQHANVDARSSVLNYVFATPEVHRMHHRADEGSQTNFSAFFVLMDHLFGTYRPVQPFEAPVRVGLRDEPEFPKDFWSHLTIPFRRDAVAAANEAEPGPDRPSARGARR
jgi:sterol desaturase/sphingolipid hydroxylase (fatty acid hydroxylase superfamily)